MRAIMFFLRCAFWLGLVFLAMARDAGAFAFLANDGGPSPAQAARLLDQACARSPDLCRKAAERAAAFATRAVTDGSAQTLQAADFTPGWRGSSER
jgi:hypothetical protein